jgi:hypothetical protein
MARSFTPWGDREAAVERLLDAREAGATLKQAAAAAGVHVATVCRWQARDRRVREALAYVGEFARWQRFLARQSARRPRVRCHPDCPACGAAVAVRRAFCWLRFWRCSRWPFCRWASWRPRHPQDCPDCDSPRYWSHSRLSIACPCGRRRVRCEQVDTIKKALEHPPSEASDAK